MNDREISELKLDMLFKIFGISIVDHEEEVIFCDHIISGRHIIPSMQKDIQIGILEEKEPWYIRGRYDSYDVLREAVHILEHIDNSETFEISCERWPILTQRRPFIHTLERRANIFLKECRYLPDFSNFKITGFSTVNECSHIIRIYMGNGAIVERSMNGKDLGRGYYSKLVFVLLNMFEEVLEIQEKIDKERHNENEKLILSILGPTYFYTPWAGSWRFEVLPSVRLSDLSLESIKSHVQPKLYIPDVDIIALERNINREFKRCYNRFENCWIEINSFTDNYILNIRFQGLAFNKSINRDMLYHYIIHILEELIWKADEMEAKAELSAKTKLEKIYLNGFYGLGADFDGDACVIMQRGRGYGKSMLQLMELNKLLKNGVSKIQIAPGKVEKLRNDILDSYCYLYDFGFMKNCTAAMVQYCKADADAAMRAYLAMKENNKQVVLEQLKEVDPQVPIKQFENLVTGSPNGEPEIIIGVDISNKEDKTMMIPVVRRPEIKEVIFNEPATIVFWKDGTKTVVKCGKDDKFDPEKGVAIALAKKMLYSKDYSRVIASSNDWKKAKEAKKKAAAKKKPMPKLPVNANVTKTSTVKKTTRKGAK